MSQRCEHLQAVVFDWAGTTIDYGSRAPAIVFQEIFRRRGLEITEAQAREPMGMAKRDHIAAIAAMPEVSAAWTAKFGQPISEQQIDALYQDFLPLQKETLKRHSDVIAGVADAVKRCRTMGLRIGSTTGYTRELMEVATEIARQQGYVPDCVLCAEDAPRGRPAPFLLYEAAKRLDVYPLWRIVKVDDTPVGIEAGRNAGCWTIGVTLTGNCVGRSVDDIAALPPGIVSELCDRAAQQLSDAGAHYTVLSAAEVPELIHEIDRRLARGERPGVG
jgi:phosphonoacetaldehyde hydrolase